MEKEPIGHEDEVLKFKGVLTDEEIKLLTHIHIHGRLQAVYRVDAVT